MSKTLSQGMRSELGRGISKGAWDHGLFSELRCMNQRLRCLSPSLPEVMGCPMAVVMAAALSVALGGKAIESPGLCLLSLGHGLRTFHKSAGGSAELGR